MFITYQQIQARRDAKAAAIDALKAAVADKDPNPLIPGEQYTGGDMFDGFVAGMIVAADDTHIAVWSKLAARVAIVPTHRIENIPGVGAIVAIHSWGSRSRRCVQLSANYGWLDAFDDFIVAFQRLDRDYRMSLANDGLCGDIFVLDARGEVASWYRNHLASNARYNDESIQYFRDLNDA